MSLNLFFFSSAFLAPDFLMNTVFLVREFIRKTMVIITLRKGLIRSFSAYDNIALILVFEIRMSK